MTARVTSKDRHVAYQKNGGYFMAFIKKRTENEQKQLMLGVHGSTCWLMPGSVFASDGA